MEKEQRLEILKDHLDNKTLSKFEIAVLQQIYIYWNQENTSGGPSSQDIAEILGISRKSVKKTRDELAEKLGFTKGM